MIVLRYGSSFLLLILILVQFPQIPGFDAYADDVILPNWIFKVSEYWQNGEISDGEFINAIDYLHDRNIVQLVMGRNYDTISNFLITSLSEKDESVPSVNCNPDWYITGYYTPIESDFSGEFVEVTFDDGTKQFKADFLDKVKKEGWGKTRFGEYVGWYDNSFHLSNTVLDVHGNRLLIPSVAVDTILIELNTKLFIPTLPTPWNELVFTASDIGPSIKGKHIDVYTGEGTQAELETFRITGTDNEVCTET